MPRLLLIRHGSTDPMGKILCGRMPGIALNAAGKEQARTLGRALAGIGDLRAVYSSPLERAQQTAQPLAEAHKLRIVTDEHFDEVAYGEWTGLPFEEIARDPRWEPYNRFRAFGSAPGGEGILAVQERAWRGVHSILTHHPVGTVAIVSHADVIRALLLLFLAMPLDCILRLEIAPASISTVSVAIGAPPVVHSTNIPSNLSSS